MSINYSEKIPNNVNLSEPPWSTGSRRSSTGRRMMESHHFDVYLRTAVSVEPPVRPGDTLTMRVDVLDVSRLQSGSMGTVV